MIILDKTVITEENKTLLDDDLSGKSLSFRWKSAESRAAWFHRQGLSDWKNDIRWQISNDNLPCLECRLVSAFEPSAFEDRNYEAVVLDRETGEIEAWNLVTICSSGSELPETHGKVQFSLFGLHIGFDSDSRELIHDDYTISIRGGWSLYQREFLQKKFDLYPGAAIHNAIKRDRANLLFSLSRLERLDSMVEEMRERRLADFSEATDLDRWKEYELRDEARNLRFSSFGTLPGFVDLEDFWFDVARGRIKAAFLVIPQQKQVYLRNGQLLEFTSIHSNDIYVSIRGTSEGYYVKLMHVSEDIDEIFEQTVGKNLELELELKSTKLQGFFILIGEERFSPLKSTAG